MNEESIKKEFSKIKTRLDKLEKTVFQDKKLTITQVSDYSGLRGGIRLLINNSFFSNPKSLNEIMEELQRENYHYGIAVVAEALSVSFTKKQKVLTRFKEGKIFKYVIRK